MQILQEQKSTPANFTENRSCVFGISAIRGSCRTTFCMSEVLVPSINLGGIPQRGFHLEEVLT